MKMAKSSIEYRWGAGDTERYRAIAAELVALAPDVVLADPHSRGDLAKAPQARFEERGRLGAMLLA